MVTIELFSPSPARDWLLATIIGASLATIIAYTAHREAGKKRKPWIIVMGILFSAYVTFLFGARMDHQTAVTVTDETVTIHHSRLPDTVIPTMSIWRVEEVFRRETVLELTTYDGTRYSFTGVREQIAAAVGSRTKLHDASTPGKILWIR